MNRYPSEPELQQIAQWDYHDLHGLLAFVKSIWEYADIGYFKHDGDKYRLITGGWSGNEDIIGALQENVMFWSMCWQSSHRGGLYEFEVRPIANATPLQKTQAAVQALEEK